MRYTAQTIYKRKGRVWIVRRQTLLGVFVLFLFVVSFFSLFSVSAHAQETQRTITIVPPSISLSLNPGDKSEGQLKVINDSDSPLTFTVGTQDFIVQDTIGTPDFVPQDTFGKPYSAASWIGIVPDSFTVQPHEKELLNYYLQVPSNARPGGHYAGIIYTPTTSLGIKGSGASVQTQIGTLFSIDIAGPIHEEAHVINFSAGGFHEYGPVDIMTQILNKGDLHIKPLGTITVYNMFGQKIGILPLDSHNIFPQSARDYVNVFGQHWMIGPFTAKFAASYGRDGNLPLVASVTFWVFPWRITILIFLIIIAAILGFLVWRHRKEGYHLRQKDNINNDQGSITNSQPEHHTQK